MRSFFNKVFRIPHQYPVKIWDFALFGENPIAITYDGSSLRLINVSTGHIAKTKSIHKIGAFSTSIFLHTKAAFCENFFLFAKEARNIYAVDQNLNHIPEFDFDLGMTVICFHWVYETQTLFAAGTNGWIKSYKLTTAQKVTHFEANWTPVYEIRSTEDWVVSMTHDNYFNLLYGAAGDTLYAWDLASGDFRFRVKLHDGFRICQIAVSEDASILISSAVDGNIILWHIQPSSCRSFQKIQVSSPGFVSFAFDDKYITAIGSSQILRHFRIGADSEVCSIDLGSEDAKQEIGDVIKITMKMLILPEGPICATCCKEKLDVVALSSSQQEFISTSEPVNLMSYSDQELLCKCRSNLIISKSFGRLFDIDMIGEGSSRSPISEVTALFQKNGWVYAGLKNGLIKCINSLTKECKVLEDVDLEDSIVYLSAMDRKFDTSHTRCLDNPESVIMGFTKCGCAYFWCPKCNACVLHQSLIHSELKSVSTFDDLVVLASSSSISVFCLSKFSFRPLIEMPRVGSKEITSICLAGSDMILCGTSSGEIQIFNLEKEGFFLQQQMVPATFSVKCIFYDPTSKIVSCCFSDGTLFVFEPRKGIITMNQKNFDADPLSAVTFHRSPEKVSCYLAFGSHIHYIVVNTLIPPTLEEEEENVFIEEEVQEEIFEEEEDHREPYYEPTEPEPEPIPEEKSVTKKKVKKVQETVEEEPHPQFEMPPKSMVSLKDVEERNAKRAESALIGFEPQSKKKLKKKQRSMSINELSASDLFDLTLRPSSLRDNPQPPEIPPIPIKFRNLLQQKQSLKLTGRSVVYKDGDNWAEIGEGIFDDSSMFPTQPTRFIIQKSKSSREKPKVVFHTNFVGAPPAPRMLFDDPSTLNALEFYDPRGFSTTFEKEKNAEIEAEKHRPKTSLKKKEQTFDFHLQPKARSKSVANMEKPAFINRIEETTPKTSRPPDPQRKQEKPKPIVKKVEKAEKKEDNHKKEIKVQKVRTGKKGEVKIEKGAKKTESPPIIIKNAPSPKKDKKEIPKSITITPKPKRERLADFKIHKKGSSPKAEPAKEISKQEEPPKSDSVQKMDATVQNSIEINLSELANRIPKAEKKEVRKLKDQPIVLKKLKSSIVDHQKPTKKKPIEDNAKTRKAMEGQKQKKHRASSAQPEKIEVQKEEEKIEQKPPEPEKIEPTPKPIVVEKAVPVEKKAPPEQKKSERIIKKVASPFFTSNESLFPRNPAFRHKDVNFAEEEQKKKDDEGGYLFLSSMADFWKQAHIYPSTKMPNGKGLFVRRQTVTEEDLPARYPKASPLPFAPETEADMQELLKKFDAIYARQTGARAALACAPCRRMSF